MKNNLSKFRKIKFLLFDLDGVLINKVLSSRTDLVLESLKHVKSYIDSFHKHSYKIGIISARPDDDVTKFLGTLNFDELFISSIDKVSPIKKMLDDNELNFEELFYVGDDILDLHLMQKAGLSMCPNDARREVKRIADYICENSSGEKVLSEILKLIEESKIELK